MTAYILHTEDIFSHDLDMIDGLVPVVVSCVSCCCFLGETGKTDFMNNRGTSIITTV